MALLVYQNQLSMDLIIPGWESTFHLYPGEYVGGEYYTRFSPSLLTDVTSENIPVEDIKYIYPGSTDAPDGGGGIDTINGTDPVQTSTLDGVTTISLRPLTATDIASGELVTGINGFTDSVTVAGSTGITVTNSLNTVTISNTLPGLTTTNAAAPLYLTLEDDNQTLSGYIAITPLADGGAVALQQVEDRPVYQIGFAALDNVYVSNGIHAGGSLNTTSGLNANALSLFEITAINPLTGELVASDSWLNLSANSLDNSFIDFDVTFRGHIILGEESNRIPGTWGNILGSLNPDSTSPLVSLSSSVVSTTPLLRFSTTQIYPDITGTTVLSYIDGEDAVLVKIYDNGQIDAKEINVDTINATTGNIETVNATTINAETLNTNSTFVTGPATINVTTAGPNTIMADCSAGAVVVQLPDLNTFTKSLTVTVIKVDNSNNDLSVINGLNSTINGSTLAINLTNQYETMTIVSNGIKWFKIGAM